MSGDRRTVLVVDDEPQIVRALTVLLRDGGFVAVTAGTVRDALDQAALRNPDAAIVDLMLPDGTGVDVCRGLREWSGMPIIVLSAVGDEEQKVRALEGGADDYVTKPFGSGELLARLRAVLRRVAVEEEPVVEVRDLRVDLAAQRVERAGEPVHLTRTEFGLLRMLIRNPGKLLTHQALLREVWGEAYLDEHATLRTHMANLRRKVDRPGAASERLIRTETGLGYRLER